MKFRNAVFPLLAIGFFAYVSWEHLRDLLQIANTYVKFPSLKKELYTYPPTYEEAEAASLSEPLAPKILHQIILSEGRSDSFAKYESARQSCVSVHPDWQHWLWTDENATEWVSTQYPDILPHYLHYPQTIQRTNILRYLLLHQYGGVYLDMDITCRVPLDDLRHLPFLTPGAYPAGINNAFILTKPQHPFLTEAIAKIERHNLKWALPYVENMLSTGCMFISNAWMEYMAHNDEHKWENKVFILADQAGKLEGHMLRGKITTPLFEHGGASSWHGWDSQVILLIGQHYTFLLVICSAAVVFWIGIILCAIMGRPAFMKRRRVSGYDYEKLWQDRE